MNTEPVNSNNILNQDDILKNITDTFRQLDSNKPQNGYMLIPSIDGFDVFEIESEQLKSLLAIESMRRKNNLKTHGLPEIAQTPFYFSK